MKRLAQLLCLNSFILISACGPVKNQIAHQYKIDAYSKKRLAKKSSNRSILVTKPKAVSGYQSNRMIYVTKPYQLSSFAKNQWVSAPAAMFMPLLVESLSNSGYFYAVAVTPYGGKSDFHVDTVIMNWQQNFLTKPSRLQMAVKVIVLNNNNKPLASKTFAKNIPTHQDTPYGGVVAANVAAEQITGEITQFVVNTVRRI